MKSSPCTTQTKGFAGTAVLEGERINLRPIGEADLPVLAGWDGDPAIIAVMGRRFAEQSPERWLKGLQTRRSSRAWIIEMDDQPVGEVELAQINNRSGTAEIRICIGEKERWGQGIGGEAMRLILAHAFEAMRLAAIYLRVFTTNERAVRLYERLGFRKEAILPASERRGDPAPVLLMNLTRARWALRNRTAVS